MSNNRVSTVQPNVLESLLSTHRFYSLSLNQVRYADKNPYNLIELMYHLHTGLWKEINSKNNMLQA